MKLEDYLQSSNIELLNKFKWGNDGSNEFEKFMSLIREKHPVGDETEEERKEAYLKVRGRM